MGLKFSITTTTFNNCGMFFIWLFLGSVGLVFCKLSAAMNSLSSVENVVVLIGIVWCFFISPLIYYFWLKNSLIINKEKTKEINAQCVLYLIKTWLNFTSNFLDQNNLKSKYYYTMMWMLRALWLVVAHDLSEYMDDVTRNLFSLLCSTWRTVLKMFVKLLRIKESELLEKSSTGAIYKKAKWRDEDKKSSWLL